MAATRFIAMHIGKGKSIAESIKGRTNYAKNPDKTDGGRLVTSFDCNARIVDAEFLLAKRQYASITGRQIRKHDVLAYQIRQSFKPGEVTPEEANKIGYELAMRFTKGKHAFIVATHIDKAHIHNHIIFNSTVLDCSRKFRDFLGTGKAVRRLSDQICLEHGLSIIENPKRSGKSYNKWLGDKKPLSHQEKLRQVINAVLLERPADFDAFLMKMKAAGYEIKRGKYPAFRAQGEKKFTRLRSLGEGYDWNESRVFVQSISWNTSASSLSVNMYGKNVAFPPAYLFGSTYASSPMEVRYPAKPRMKQALPWKPEALRAFTHCIAKPFVRIVSDGKCCEQYLSKLIACPKYVLREYQQSVRCKLVRNDCEEFPYGHFLAAVFRRANRPASVSNNFQKTVG